MFQDELQLNAQRTKTLLADEAEAFNNNLISYQEHFNRKEAIIKQDAATQEEIYNRILAVARKTGDTAKISDVEGKLAELQLKKETEISAAQNERLKNAFQFNKELISINQEYYTLVGKEEEAIASKIKDQFADRLNAVNLQIEAGRTELQVEKDKLLLIQKVSEMRAKFAVQEKQANLAIAQSRLDEERIARDLQIGAITELQAIERTDEVRKAERETLIKLLETENALVAAGDKSLETEQKRLNLIQEINRTQSANAGFNQGYISNQIGNSGIGAVYKQYQTDIAKAQSDLQSSLSSSAFAYNISDKSAQAQQKLLDSQLKAQKAYTDATAMMHTNMYAGMFAVGADTFMQLTLASQKMYGAQSKQAKTMFALYKAMKVSEIIMSTATTVMAMMNAGAQWGPAGVVMGPAAAAVAAAMGAIQIATVIAQPLPAAHGGLNYVPKEQTYLLDKGERVLSPRQNKDLTSYLDQRNMNKQQSGSSPNIRIINAVDPDVFHEYLGSDQGEKVVMNIVRRNQGVGVN